MLVKYSKMVLDTKYHFWVFGMTQPGIEHQSPGLLENNEYNSMYFIARAEMNRKDNI